MIHASACGKVILCGEHAVVYGQAALALPFQNCRARVSLQPQAQGLSLAVPALNLTLDLNPTLEPTAAEHPLAMTLRQALAAFEVSHPACRVEIHSELPIGRGLGSGAALSAAVFRACAQYAGQSYALPVELAFIHKLETLYHGQPSGIDGHVIAYEQAMVFQREQPPRLLNIPGGSHVLIADSGPAPPTHEVVGFVRQAATAQPQRYGEIFTAIGELAQAAESCLHQADWPGLGQVLNQNHSWLQQMGVSSSRLDQLVDLARAAGAYGAKLSGAGQGGVCLALCPAQAQSQISQAWQAAGVTQIWSLEM